MSGSAWTSKEAANTVSCNRKHETKRQILIYVYKYAPVNREDIMIALDMAYGTVGARVSELIRDGLLFECGSKPTTHGRKAKAIFTADRIKR